MELNRRQLLQGAACLAASGFLPTPANAAAPRFRFVHITDLHLQPELGATEGVALAVKKIRSLRPHPDFILSGGDHVMDVLSVPRERADLQFRLLEEALKPLEIPVRYAVGNHDVYGWGRKESNPSQEVDYGKKMFEERIIKGGSYSAVTENGWRFIILDSIQKAGERAWRAEIDDAQLQWLKDDLEKTGKKTPIVIMSHVPIMTLFTQYANGTTVAPTETGIVRNGKEVRDVFKDYNVKAVLQGHTHVVEDCAYTGTRYITSGAICGDWWKGPRLGVHPEGFSVFDVQGENLRWEYISYGWTART